MGVVDRDPGLPAERTDLSWSRTSIAVIVSGVLVSARELITQGEQTSIAIWVGLASSIVIAGIVAGIGRRRRRRLITYPPVKPVAAPREITAVAAAICVLVVILVPVAVVAAPH